MKDKIKQAKILEDYKIKIQNRLSKKIKKEDALYEKQLEKLSQNEKDAKEINSGIDKIILSYNKVHQKREASIKRVFSSNPKELELRLSREKVLFDLKVELISQSFVTPESTKAHKIELSQKHELIIADLNKWADSKNIGRQLEFNEILQIDKTRYQKNSLPYWLILGGLVLSIIAMFMTINKIAFNERSIVNGRFAFDYVLFTFVALEIVIGIISMLLTFLCAEKVKLFSPLWCKVIIFVIAGINVARILFLPLYTVKLYNDINYILTPLILWLVAALMYVVAGVISHKKVTKLLNYLSDLKKETIK